MSDLIKGHEARPGGPEYLLHRDTYKGTTYTYRFTVAGRGAFPVDMLRYDQCYPVDGDSALNIVITDGETRTVDLRSVQSSLSWAPTFDRWRSFGWFVTTSQHYSTPMEDEMKAYTVTYETAARAMLAALKAAESRIETPDDLNVDEKRHVQEDIRAAIAQAEAAGIKGSP